MKNQEEENHIGVNDHIQHIIDQNLDSENEIHDEDLLENLTQPSDGSDLLNEVEREL